MTVIYVGGVKGVGKSFALSGVFECLSLNDIAYERIKISEIMLNLLRNDGIIDDYDGLENLDPDIKGNARHKAFDQVLQDCQQPILIFDGHYAVPSGSGYEYGIPFDFIQNIDYLVLLSNKAQVIHSRRSQDSSRNRQVDFAKVCLDLFMEHVYAVYYAGIKGCDLETIETGQQVAKELIEFITGVI